MTDDWTIDVAVEDDKIAVHASRNDGLCTILRIEASDARRLGEMLQAAADLHDLAKQKRESLS